MTPEEIDKIICDWSLEFGVAMTSQALDALVDRLSKNNLECGAV